MIPVYLCQGYPYLPETTVLIEKIISQEFEGELELRVASEYWGDIFSIMNDGPFICIIDHIKNSLRKFYKNIMKRGCYTGDHF